MSLLDDLLTNPDGTPAAVSLPRRKFIAWQLAQKGKTVLWAAKGPNEFDCSGLYTSGIRASGGPDLRLTWNAQRLFDASLPTSVPLAGDAVFYGTSIHQVIHIATWCPNGWVLSASGATRRIKTVEDARAVGAEVRLHSRVQYRNDFLGFHRNLWIEQLEALETNK